MVMPIRNFREISENFREVQILKGESMQTVQATVQTQAVDKTASQLAEDFGVTSRMVNVYRAAAEKIAGKKLGQKRGKTVWFSPEEQELINKARFNALDTLKSAGEQIEETAEIPQNFPEAQHTQPTLQGELAGGLVGMKDSLYGGGIALGRTIGKEFAKGLKQGIGEELTELIVDLEIVTDNLLAVTQGAATLPTSAPHDMPAITGTGAGFW